MNNAYESTFIVDAHQTTEQIESTIEKYSKIITDNGGVIKLVDRWGKRRLAYEIAKKQYGYYVYLRFDSEGTLIKILEREYKLDEHVIRYLTVTVPKSMVMQEEVAKLKAQEVETDEDTDIELDGSGSDEDALDDKSEDINTDEENVEDDEKDAKQEV